MSGDGFWRQAGIALLLSTGGAVLHAAASPVLGPGVALRGVIIALGGAYLAWMMRDSHARTGVLVSVAVWLCFCAGLCLLDPALGGWVLVQTLAIWVLRSLHRHDTFGAAAADAALCVVALAAAVATSRSTHSLFLTLWTYFLVQSMFVFLPSSREPRLTSTSATPSNDAFGRSLRTAEAALRHLSIRP